MTFLTVMIEPEKSDEDMSTDDSETEPESTRGEVAVPEATAQSEVPNHVVQKTNEILNMIRAAEKSIKKQIKKLRKKVTLLGETQSNENSIVQVTLMDVNKYIMGLTDIVDTFFTKISSKIYRMTMGILNIISLAIFKSIKIAILNRKFPNLDYPGPSQDYYFEVNEVKYLAEHSVEDSNKLIFSKTDVILDTIRWLISCAQYCAFHYFVGVKSLMFNTLDDLKNTSEVTLRAMEAMRRQTSREESSENEDFESPDETEDSLITLISDEINDVIRDARVQLDSSQEMSRKILDEESQNICATLSNIIANYFLETEQCMLNILGTTPGALSQANYWVGYLSETSPNTIESLMELSFREAKETPKDGFQFLISVFTAFQTEIKRELDRILECVNTISGKNLERARSITSTTEKKIEDILQKGFSFANNATEESEAS